MVRAGHGSTRRHQRQAVPGRCKSRPALSSASMRTTTAAAWARPPRRKCSSRFSPPGGPDWVPASGAAEPDGDWPGVAEASPDPGRAAQSLALLADDEPAVRQAVRRLLLHPGFAVIEAENSAGALQLRDQTPGTVLLLTDVLMPGALDVRALAHHADTHCGAPRVVRMGGFAPDAGTDGKLPRLTKPFTRTALAALLQSAWPCTCRRKPIHTCPLCQLCQLWRLDAGLRGQHPVRRRRHRTPARRGQNPGAAGLCRAAAPNFDACATGGPA